VGLGVFLLAVSGCLAVHNAWVVRSSVSTPGTVVSVSEQRVKARGAEHVYCVPVVQYFDAEGNEYRIEAALDGREPTPVGTVLPVLYSPDEPGHARLGGPPLSDWPRRLTLTGCCCLGLGGLLIVVSRCVFSRGFR
jgi:hypothetical protein